MRRTKKAGICKFMKQIGKVLVNNNSHIWYKLEQGLLKQKSCKCSFSIKKLYMLYCFISHLKSFNNLKTPLYTYCVHHLQKWTVSAKH